MALTRVLITVKTYPTLSETHTELVCTAGFREDGTMIRIYPVPFRMLNEYQKYKKYQWISIDLNGGVEILDLKVILLWILIKASNSKRL